MNSDVNVTPMSTSPEHLTAAPAGGERNAVESSMFETNLDHELQAAAQSFRALMSDPCTDEGASGTAEGDQPDSDAEPPAGPLSLMQRVADSRRDPDSRRKPDLLPDPDSRGGIVTDVQSLLYLHLRLPSAPLPPSAPAPDPQAVAAGAPDPDVSFAELIGRHLRRLAVKATDDPGSDEVLLELSDRVLPETTLSLRRSPHGWHLTAMTGNRQSLERLDRFAPALVQRFAAASLGTLEVTAHLT